MASKCPEFIDPGGPKLSLERAVRAVAEQAAAADALVREAMAADFDGPDLAGSHAVTLRAKVLRLEPLNVKSDLGFSTYEG